MQERRSRQTGPAAAALLAVGFVVLVQPLVAQPALAQYDRDGKYVPSPMGVPADPYSKPIPNYSGKPGAAIGTPVWPRIEPYQQPNALAPRPEVPVTRRPSNTLPVPINVDQCEDGWSKSTRVPRVEFNRRCRVILRKSR